MDDDSLEDCRIVLVDEDAHQRQLLVWELTGLGFRNVSAIDRPLSALEHIADFPTDLLITDYHIDLLHLLRNHPRSPAPELPVIMVTARADADTVATARDAGVDEFLVKPVEPDDLYAHIRNTLERRRKVVKEDGYRGPDRRRRHVPVEGDKDRRNNP